MRIDDILDKIIENFQKEPSLMEVKKFHKVNGMLPTPSGVSISLGCEGIKYNQYDKALDEASADILIYVYLQHANAEVGEKKIRNLASEIKNLLVSKPRLDGAVSSSFVDEIEYVYADASQTMFWHAAVIHFGAMYFEDRIKEKEGYKADYVENKVERV